jgi:integrase
MPNIERRKNVWYATLHVPPDVTLALGKRKFFQSLKTTDKRIAESRATVIVAGWKAQIQLARGTSDPFIDRAMDWRHQITTATDPVAVDAIEELLIEDIERHIEPKYGPKEAGRFFAVALGKQALLAPMIPKWRAMLDLAPKTIDQMEKDVKRMVKQFPTAQAINRESVHAWLVSLSEGESKLSPSSLRRIVGFCRNFWRYLQETAAGPKGEIPFSVPSFAQKRKTRKSQSGWIPFAPLDVMVLRNEAADKGDQQLANLIELGAYTGARIEELCALKLSEIKDNSMMITESKTEAGIREVPIHSKLKPLVQRLKSESSDGYLLSGLTFNKYDDRSNAIGKRFGRLKKSMGYQEKQVFHSIRKTVVTILENAGTPENLAADIVGHDKPRITYGLYSGGFSLDAKRKAVEKIKYPKP